MLAFAYSKSGNVVEEQTLFTYSGEEPPECQLARNVATINQYLSNYGALKPVGGARHPSLAMYALHHEIGCELGVRFITKIIHESELWQKRTLPSLALEAAQLMQHSQQPCELAGLTFVLKRNGEAMVFFTENHELDLVMSSLEVQSRMMTLREGAQVLRGHFLLA
ncbi:hypothetical protein ACFOEE_11845 [Pseudoalteromonas fenneropenaei]|uniref:Uncharacterized protein n=1 Tax=Pseudoalteromonas fenneropenaei TaxID=1737459 RepID=A0ABV7CKR5_9GAMM